MSVRVPGARSRRLFRTAERVLVGGVDSPVRSFRAVGGTPVFFRRGAGAYLEDVDGRRYLDLVGSWGANLLGNAPVAVVRAVRNASRNGLGFGAPTEVEHTLGRRIQQAIRAAERVRFVSSGTEAVMSAVRVARGFTGRPKILAFEGGYHGHSDGLLARAGSGLATVSLPNSAGVPRAITSETLIARYNDLEQVEWVFERHGDSIAAALVEPVAGNMGVVPPQPGFLSALAGLCRKSHALFIADEVITGFRLRGGAISELMGVRPDLITLGKVIGGGLPVGAYAGSRTIMNSVAPIGPVYQAGTLAGNPVVMAAGIAALDALTPARYRALESRARELEALLDRARGRLEPFAIQRVGSMFGLFFAHGPVTNFVEAKRSNTRAYSAFFHAALRRGVYLPPSALETTFLSMAVSASDLRRAEPAFRAAFSAARERA